ncbi:MAG TPA: hypothetical protein VNI02_08385 [Blastocatellia bacterium]|nr:hypothetical protein [Blastocatellia bacterium]
MFLLSLKSLGLILWQAGSPLASPTASPVASAINQAAQEGNSTLTDYLFNPFVIAIWLLFLASTFAMLRYLRQLPKEHAELDQVLKNYGDVIETIETNPEAVREELLKGVDSYALVARRVDELHWISTHGGDFDQVALGEVLAAREGAKVSIARYGASVLVLLGLCGAIWGLSNLVFQMGPELKHMEKLAQSSNAQSTAPIQESVGTLISTMGNSLEHTKGAFFASLTGIILSVLLLFMNWVVSRRQVRFLAELEDVTASRLVPIFKPPRESSELASVVDSFKEGSSYLVRLSDELDGKVMQVGGNLENLFAIVRKFGDGAEALQVNQKSVFEAQTRMLGVVEEFTGLTERIEAHQAESKERIDQVISAVQDSNKNFTRAIEEWQQKHETLLQLIQQSSKEAHYEAKKARELAQESINETTELIKTSIDRQLNELRAQALEMLSNQQAGNRQQLTEVVEKQGEFVNTLQAAVLNGNGHRELLDGMNRAMEQERNSFSERFDRMLEQELSVFSDRLDRMLDQNERVIDAIKEQRPAQVFALPDAGGGGRLQNASVETHPDHSAPLIAKQEMLIRQVGTLGHYASRLSSLLMVLIGFAAFSLPVLGALGIMRTFQLWPDDTLWQVITLGGIVLVSASLTYGVTWFLRERS